MKKFLTMLWKFLRQNDGVRINTNLQENEFLEKITVENSPSLWFISGRLIVVFGLSSLLPLMPLLCLV